MSGPPSPVPPQSLPESAVREAVECIGCGYNLWGLDVSGLCPECCAPLKLSLPDSWTASAGSEPASPLDDDVSCVRCGRNLRGLSIAGVCRGCRTPVWFSASPAPLEACPSAWLYRMRSGVTLWAWMTITTIVVGAVLGAIVGIIGLQAASATTRAGGGRVVDLADLERQGLLVGTIVGLIAGTMNLFVVWRLTTPHPAIVHYRGVQTRRAWMQAGAWWGLLVALVVLAGQLLGLSIRAIGVISILGLPGILVAIGLFRRLRELAIRSRRRRMIRSTEVLMWVICGSAVVLQTMGLIQMLVPALASAARTTPPNPSSLLYSCGVGVISLVSFGFTIWLIVVLFRCRATLGRALRFSPDAMSG